MKTFQTVVLGIFGAFIVVGIIVIASYGKFGGSNSKKNIPAEGVVWGTLEATKVSEVIRKFNEAYDNILKITYQQFPEETFDVLLTEALAEGRGPDLIIVASDKLLLHQQKIYPTPFEVLSERSFRDAFTQGSEIFISPQGILALPLFSDPLVLYWNRTIFNSEGISFPPKLWEEVSALSPKLTQADSTHAITRSSIALGEYRNISHAKEIMATLIMQAGNPITIRRGEEFQSILTDRLGFPENPADAAIRFYTEFANPLKPSYSWNRSLIDSRESFIRGDLAMYLGFASELFLIQERNPNLNFDVTRIPQVRDAVDKSTFGKIYGMAILNQSRIKPNAFQSATILSDTFSSNLWSEIFSLPPVRRALLSRLPNDPFMAVFYQESLIARGFFDPNPSGSGAIFQTLIEDVTSGQSSVSRAVSDANSRLNAIIKR
jgi:ABC-type glycerol-3-phosphate transport system substrate-binding protein